MQRSICRFLAAASLLICWRAGEVAGRPHYGGTLRVEMRETVRSLDPDDKPANRLESVAKDKLMALLFEPLVRLDENGRPQAVLALSWQQNSEGKQWRFRLRTDVKFHDGSVLTPEEAATALRSSADGWKITALRDGLLIESDASMPDLLFDLAQPSHSIFFRAPDQTLSGTGPFQLAKWEPGRQAVFTANEQHWAGRPFLDAVSIEMGRPLTEQLMDLELGKADFVEIWPNEMRRVPKGTKLWSSQPDTLIALAFERGRPAIEDMQLREALALSIDRAAILNWLMQKQGETAASLLPQRLSGYAFLFSAQADVNKARQLISKTGKLPPALLLAYDALDPLARSMADRIALNAREAGITLKVSGHPLNADIRLMRLPIRSSLPRTALADLISSLRQNGSDLPNPASAENLHAAEKAALAGYYVIPLFHVPEIYGSSSRLKTWTTSGISQLGDWRLDDMWLDAEKP
jgi:peptide/nickel transport system substrate-binding protein